ncbi:MAG: protein-methionine-sulfoxide reductase catalytic subunit MsrP [Alphaproteobacteria bacterium]|nr:protein-methionine-sulfoxide reductase catalytic subunit MsrP [Alphaproteobacteria bacterium]
MLIRRPPDIKPSEITPRGLYLDRRRFMLAAGALILLPGAAGAALRFDGAVKTRWGEGLDVTSVEDATSYNNFVELGSDKSSPKRNAAALVTRPWSVTVEGECLKPGALGVEDLLAPHPLEERIYRLRCVEGWSMVIPWVGVPLGRVLQRFEPTSRAKWVEFTTLHDPQRLPGQRRAVLDWPYVEGLRIDEATHPLSLLAVGMYGDELPAQNGAPLRLVVPWKYGFKSIKSIVRIRFSETRPKTTWNIAQPDEYGFWANVNPEVDHPRWSQKKERRIGQFFKIKTDMFNGYASEVAHLYAGMDLARDF